MNRKQLQTLISAGVFSAALLSGAAYADDAATNGAGTAAPATPAAPAATTPGAPAGTMTPAKPAKHKKHKKTDAKAMAQHDCKGKNSCKGQGGCQTGDAGCAGKNS